MVLKPLQSDDIESNGSDQLGFFSPFYQVFRKKFIKFLARGFRQMKYKLAMSILDPKINFSEVDAASSSSSGDLSSISETLASYAMEQLEAYTNNLADYRMTEDFVDDLARAYMMEKIPVSLSYAQASVLLCIGLQGKDISRIEVDMKVERQQIMSPYMKVMKKFHKYLSSIASKDTLPTISRLKEIALEPHPVSVDDDLNDAAKQVEEKMRSKVEAGGHNPDAAVDRDDEFENALQTGDVKIQPGSVISIKSDRKKFEKQKESKSNEKKRNKHDHSSKSNKKRKT